MSEVKKILGKESIDENEDTYTEDTYSEEQEAFFIKEGFQWNEYTDWNFHDTKDSYKVWIDAHVHYFSLYIYKGEYPSECELEETFFWHSQPEFEKAYELVLEKIKKFFK